VDSYVGCEARQGVVALSAKGIVVVTKQAPEGQTAIPAKRLSRIDDEKTHGGIAI